MLYIHPRYLVFTMVMAAVALGLCALRVALVVRASRRIAAVAHDDDDDDPPPAGTGQRVLSIGALAVAALVALSMMVLPPATLSSATALQRDVGAGAAAASGVTTASASTTETAHFSVLEWASLLRQTDQLSYFAGKPVDVTGFVTPDPTDPANVFFVTRFVITCCAVDAQPVGVPVYQPDWRSSWAPNTWLRVTGTFQADRSSSSSASIALVATGVKKVDEPHDPYLY